MKRTPEILKLLQKPFLTTEEAAKILGISAGRVRQLLLAGRIPDAVKIGRDWMIPPAALEADSVAIRINGRPTFDRLKDELSIRARSRRRKQKLVPA